MLLYQIGSTFLVYRIGRTISKNAWLATVAALLFALTPYGIYFHRRVLLDNIATFWMLVAIILLLSGRLTLSKVWMSAVALGISALSKEVTVFVIPAMAYLVYWRADKGVRRFFLVSWITLVCSIGSLYVLMALIKGEMFPTGSFLGGFNPHVSLLGSISYQASRGKDGGFVNPSSGFWRQTLTWARDEPALVIGGTSLALVSAFLMKSRREQGILALLILSLWAFLARGGEDIGFYILPLLPLLALSLALNLDLIGRLTIQPMKRLTVIAKTSSIGMAALNGSMAVALIAVCLLSIGAGYTRSYDLGLDGQNLTLYWTNQQADSAVQAANWIKQNLPVDSIILIDMSMWPALRESTNPAHVFPYANDYWKAQLDPAIRDNVLHDDWRNVQYITVTPTLPAFANSERLPLVQEALAHCTVVARFDTGGWPITICKVNNGRQDGAVGLRVRIASQAARDRRPPALTHSRPVAV